jgi:hypothetical protein
MDADPNMEGGQLGRSCDGGASLNNPVTGIIKGPEVIIQGRQTCHYMHCEFLGSLTINNANATLQDCQVDGNLTKTSDTLSLGASTMRHRQYSDFQRERCQWCPQQLQYRRQRRPPARQSRVI